jgi:hypothetical protein
MPSLLGPFGNGPTQLFRRSCSLDVGKPGDDLVSLPALRIQSGAEQLGLTVAFKIEKNDKPEPNRSEIRIYNLTDSHREQLEQQGVRALLSAGYPGAEAQVFAGNVRFALTEKQGPDFITRLELSDGLQGWTEGVLNKSWSPGAILRDIVSDLAATLTSDKGNLIQALGDVGDRVFKKGFNAHGLAATELTRVLNDVGLSWSLQDGTLQILGPAQYLGDEGPLLDADHGLIGSPQVGAPERKGGPNVIKVKCLLNPAIRPGQRLQLNSKDLKGVCRCHKVTHSGVTQGGDWYTEAEVTKQQ